MNPGHVYGARWVSGHDHGDQPTSYSVGTQSARLDNEDIYFSRDLKVPTGQNIDPRNLRVKTPTNQRGESSGIAGCSRSVQM